MYHAELFGTQEAYRLHAMVTPPASHGGAAADRPLVVQFCGNDPQVLLRAAKHVEHFADGVDLNLGCPQGIARRGHYGAFLLEHTQLLHDIVATLHQHLNIPVSVKIRRLATDAATIGLVRVLEEAGAALVTVHGRTRHQMKDAVGECDWELIRLVKQNARVPVFANGGIDVWEDVQRCLAVTGVEGVMSSEALLGWPALFSGDVVKQDWRGAGRMAREYLELVAHVDGSDVSMIRAHLFKMLYQMYVGCSRCINAHSHCSAG